VVQVARNWPASSVDQLVAGEVDLLLGHVAFVAVFDQPRFQKHNAASMNADRRHIEDRRLAFELDRQLFPFRHLVPHQIGTVADRVGV